MTVVIMVDCYSGENVKLYLVRKQEIGRDDTLCRKEVSIQGARADPDWEA
jgi:hypothetical protein